jgi:hypothetical protein
MGWLPKVNQIGYISTRIMVTRVVQVPDTNPVRIGSHPVFLPIQNRSAVTIPNVNDRRIIVPNFQNGYNGLTM